ncbi:hypothetical protein PVAP13_3KG282227 [Panicum virgatum]|uniref:Protein kinase domain-containing protein n=1 Tax=Panicum virgatum TaxID=38727 RepID=A0A8T0UTB0_PANVG|nr:hypothetical protein PVAP13_3KG282227 [Panicum virgatum]
MEPSARTRRLMRLASPLFFIQLLSSLCGPLQFDIAYPFSVDGVDRPDYCSVPGYLLSCTDGVKLVTTMNSSGGGLFQVTGVDYGNRLLTVVDEGLAEQTCPQPYRNATFDGTMFAYTDRDQFLTAYVNCSASSSSLPFALDFFSCLSGGRSYYTLDNGTVAPDLLGSCSSTLVLPFNSSMAGSLVAGNSTLGDVMRGGFAVRWKAGAGWCGDCRNSGGFCGYNSSSPTDHTCFCPDGTSIGSCSSDIISAVSGGILLSLLISMGVLYRKKFEGSVSWKWGYKHTPSIESFLQKHDAQQPKRYTYSEVKRMTKSFIHKLGEGGFGTVYKGNLPNGRDIAVKLLKNSKDDGQEFMNEVASIMQTSHVNVVTLLGYCLQGSKRALIYEYMTNGSLERFTFGKSSKGEKSLSWEKLFDITVGIARGLEYLHRGCNTRIVHFDIKPHNILLDQDFSPKISDFGLVKLCIKKEIISIDGARGTIGYIAPEVFLQQFGEVSSKSDVYSYGMMVPEMVGARKNANHTSEASSKYFPQWIYDHLEEYCVTAGETSVDTELVRKLIIVGFWCIQLQPNNRPSMTRVVEMLESSTDDLRIPPQILLC